MYINCKKVQTRIVAFRINCLKLYFHLSGLYKCKGEQKCIARDKVCDGEVHCINYKDDEKYCREIGKEVLIV